MNKVKGFAGNKEFGFSWFEVTRDANSSFIDGDFQIYVKSKALLLPCPKVLYTINFVISYLFFSVKEIEENQTNSVKNKDELFADAIHSRDRWLYSEIEKFQQLNDNSDEMNEFYDFSAKRTASFDGKQGAEIEFYSDISNQGLDMFLFRNETEDRLIYSFNNGKDIFEYHYPLGTIKKTLIELNKKFQIMAHKYKAISLKNHKLKAFIGNKQFGFAFLEHFLTNDNIFIIGECDFFIDGVNILETREDYHINIIIRYLLDNIDNFPNELYFSTKNKNQLYFDIIYSHRGYTYIEVEQFEKIRNNYYEEQEKIRARLEKKYEKYPEKLGFVFNISPELTEQNLSICLARDEKQERLLYSFSAGRDIYELNLALNSVKNTLQELKIFAAKNIFLFNKSKKY